mmetsp:Transcript_496/g.1163  ORF Transcript_496/g.1163 Transcript_496/m.1163 type:complete len:269 (-) Transcript_496:275-1081(-)
MIRPVGGTEDQYFAFLGVEAVPQRQEFCLDRVAGAALRTVSRIQECIQFVNENDGRSEFHRQRECGIDQFVGFPEPLVHDLAELDGNKCCICLLGNGLCQHRLSSSGRSVQQDPARLLQQLRGEQIGPLQGKHGQFPNLLLEGVQRADVLEGYFDVAWVHDVLRHQALVRCQRRELAAIALGHDLHQPGFCGRRCLGIIRRLIASIENLSEHPRSHQRTYDEHADLYDETDDGGFDGFVLLTFLRAYHGRGGCPRRSCRAFRVQRQRP